MAEEIKKKKSGEKSLILETCWKLLSDSDERRVGGVKVTQGIYAKIDGNKTEVFCKRGVFVPESFSFERIQALFAAFGAKLNPCVSRKSAIGICGVLPTRTAHADDTEFFLVARIHEKFVVIAIMSTDEANNAIVRIQSDPSSISNAVKMAKDEAETHKKKKEHSADKTVDTCEATPKTVGIQRPREEESSIEPSPKKAEYKEDKKCDFAAEDDDVTPRSSSIDTATSLCLSECEETPYPISLFQLSEFEDQTENAFSLNSPVPFFSSRCSAGSIRMGFDNY